MIKKSTMIHFLTILTTVSTFLQEEGTGLRVRVRGKKRDRHECHIKVNIAAIPDTLIESELFGTEKGAYTGADRRIIGKFEAAHRGTFFLDEIADLSLSSQVKLLRVIQEKEVIRLGSTQPIKIDVRLISATNQNIEKMVKKIKNLLLDNAEAKISYVEGGIVKVTINGTNGFPGVVPAAAAKDAVSAG